MKKKITLFASTLFLFVLSASNAFAQAEGAADNGFTAGGLLALAAGIGLGVAAFGGAIGQGIAAKSALEGITRNPQSSGAVMAPLILSLALIEALVIYAFVISILLVLKLPNVPF